MTIDKALAKVQAEETAWRKAQTGADRAEQRRYRAWRAAHKAGASYAQIASVVGCHRSYIAQKIWEES